MGRTRVTRAFLLLLIKCGGDRTMSTFLVFQPTHGFHDTPLIQHVQCATVVPSLMTTRSSCPTDLEAGDSAFHQADRLRVQRQRRPGVLHSLRSCRVRRDQGHTGRVQGFRRRCPRARRTLCIAAGERAPVLASGLWIADGTWRRCSRRSRRLLTGTS